MTHSQSFLNILPKVPQGIPKLCVALLGGGGKTSLMYQLGKEFVTENNHVLMTSITKAGPTNNIPLHLTGSNGEIFLTQMFKSQNPVYLLRERIKDNKYKGISIAQLESFLPEADVTIFECDGSRNLPLKAHSHWDPVVPDFATHVIIVIGADVINTKLNDGKVHRLKLFKSLWDIQDDTVIDIPLITKVVTDKQGYLSKIPDSVQKIYFINKADKFHKAANALATSIAKVRSDSIFFGSIHQAWWKTIS
ncbi:MAG: putative selenium-dependent hydroxylase accessory protein YqeC [Candidatus Marinimicrobia bacterium]|nr:putative selenium-dependent hydroxylase accessory protein YqeC [Candidatus Neomarinimicrobiota bacterium]MCH7764726.1 putative selenium-dependent hydroxylase accessory protein YqeC [Candidatus Neomarinimicrobiota bacterium]